MNSALAAVKGYFGDHGIDYLAEDVVLDDKANPGLILRGKEAVAGYVQGFYGAFAESGARVGSTMEGGDAAMVEFVFWGRNQHAALGPLEPRGRNMELPIVGLYRVADGRIHQITLYYNAAALVAQLQGG